LVSPETVQVVAPVVVHVLAPGLEVTVYPVITFPPVLAGAVQVTTDWALACVVAVTPVGAPGTVDGMAGAEGAEAAEGPVGAVAVWAAVTVKV
jgi:hypothetical protein